jgi:hypothetical protein
VECELIGFQCNEERAQLGVRTAQLYDSEMKLLLREQQSNNSAVEPLRMKEVSPRAAIQACACMHGEGVSVHGEGVSVHVEGVSVHVEGVSVHVVVVCACAFLLNSC